jgi:hypothetical protein
MLTHLSAVHTQPLSLRFFDQAVALRSDTPAFVDLFGQMYRHFVMPGAGPESAWPVTLRTSGTPTLTLGDETRRLGPAGLLEGFVYEITLYAILARVRSHFLAHAGAVARDGRGVVLAGDSGHGKTTLVLELARRGWDFLSDEVAALGRAGPAAPLPARPAAASRHAGAAGAAAAVRRRSVAGETPGGRGCAVARAPQRASRPQRGGHLGE